MRKGIQKKIVPENEDHKILGTKNWGRGKKISPNYFFGVSHKKETGLFMLHAQAILWYSKVYTSTIKSAILFILLINFNIVLQQVIVFKVYSNSFL